MADPTDRGTDADSGLRAEAVASLLTERKSLLDRPPGRFAVDLPGISREAGEATTRPRPLSGSPIAQGGHPISPDPSRVDPLALGPAGASDEVERPGAEEASPAKPVGPNPPAGIDAHVELRSATGVLASASLATTPARPSPDPVPELGGGPMTAPTPDAKGAQGSSKPETPPGVRSATPPIPSAMTGRNPPGDDLVGRLSPRTDAGSPSGSESPTEAAPHVVPGRPLDRQAANVPSSVAVAGGPREGVIATPAGPMGPGRDPEPVTSVARPGLAADAGPGPPTQAGPSNPSVRNPPSVDLRALSAGPTQTPQVGALAGQGGYGQGPGDAASGVPASPQGGAPVDLSRTNELLQQLIEAVRKQRDSSLPPGGASVYPDR